jgi:hypothetical protein
VRSPRPAAAWSTTAVKPVIAPIVDLGVRGGLRPAFLAGLGTALADGLYATVAAVAGLAVGAWLAPAEHAIALVAAAALAGGGALMRHGLPPSARTWTSVAGRVLVLALAVRLALGA